MLTRYVQKYVELVKDNYIVLSLVCYGYGLTCNIIAYSFFNIPIIYYISLTDFLLFAVLQFIMILVIVLFYQYLYLRPIRYLILKKYRNKLKTAHFLVFIVAALIPTTLYLVFVIQYPEYLYGNIFTTTLIAIPLILPTFSGNLFQNSKSFIKKQAIRNTFLLFIFTSFYIYSDKKKKLDTNFRKSVSFIYNDSLQIETTKKDFFVGETSTHLFFYDSLNKNTTVYKKDKIDYIKYYD
jgi:hypothetical protein